MQKFQEHSKKKMPVFKRIFRLFDRTQKIKAIFALILVGISAGCDLAVPSVMSEIMKDIKPASNGVIDSNNVHWYLFGIMIALAIVSILVQMISVWLVMQNMVKTSSLLRTKIFTHTRYLSSQDIDRIGQGTILTITTNDVTQLEQFLSSYNSLTVKSIFFAIGGFGLSIYQLTTVDESKVWYATLSYIFIFIVLGLAGMLLLKAMPYFKMSRNSIDKNNNTMQENIIGSKLIRTLNLQKIQAKKYNKGNKELKEYLTKSEKIISLLVPISTLFLNLAMVTIYVVGGVYSWWTTSQRAGEIVGVIFAFSQYLILILLGLALFSSFGYTISRSRVSGQRIFELLDTKNSIVESKNPKTIKNGDISLKNVCFKYANSENKNTLNKINIEIKSGQSLGIIGQTGSGKSSLVKIITRLYDISSGSLKISGIDIKDIAFKSLQKDIAVSLQEKVIMSGTYKSNILIGRPNATDEEVLEAAKAAEAWEFISNKEKQLDGIVEERGSNLSGGQKQRLAIARALVKKPKILIFDDSTSALDSITENKIIKNINEMMPNVTKLIISQKVKSIQNCDKIIVLDNGRIVQQGTHKELLKDKKGIYARINDSQKTSLEG